LRKARADLSAAKATLQATRDEMADTITKLTELKAAVPGVFQQALTNYLAEIDARGPTLQQTFQSTLGVGFKGVYLLYGAACLLALLVLAGTPKSKRSDEDAEPDVAADPRSGGGVRPSSLTNRVCGRYDEGHPAPSQFNRGCCRYGAVLGAHNDHKPRRAASGLSQPVHNALKPGSTTSRRIS
jgi:hypothetical protein